MNKKSSEIVLRSGFCFGWPIVASQPDSPHAKVYKQIATRIWEKLSGATERKAPRIVVQ